MYEKYEGMPKPGPFDTKVNRKNKYLISASPERFLKKAGNSLYSQPIKGTAPRSDNKCEDTKLKENLRNDAKEISEISDATRYDMTSDVRTPEEGEIVVARNQNDYWAAMKVLDVKDRTRADDKDELTFEYVILSNGIADFRKSY